MKLSAPGLMLGSTFLFAVMGVCVKLAAPYYDAAEIVFYRGCIGAIAMAIVARSRQGTLRTPVPMMHVWRSVVGVAALSFWFVAMMNMPLATAVTLNYMSSVWMALFLIGGAVMLGSRAVDGRLVATVMVGFAGVALVLRPTIGGDQLWYGLIGLASGMLSAMAYMTLTTLGRAGEPEYRVVFYFSLGGMAVGATWMATGNAHAHTWHGALLLLAIGLLATFAQMAMTRAYAIGRVLSNASLQYLGIVFSFIFGVLVFDDPVTWMALLGMALIIGAGIAATLLRTRQAPKDSQFSAEA